MSKRTTSAVWVKGIAEMLAAEGLDAGALFAAAGSMAPPSMLPVRASNRKRSAAFGNSPSNDPGTRRSRWRNTTWCGPQASTLSVTP
jgi:hypothetical protein